jgi:seryl-tRNA synthetase
VFSTAKWAQASREVIRLRRELRGLRKEREAQQSALGAAAYADDPEETESLRRQLAELDARIGGCELAIDEAVNEARERVRRRRSAVQPTQPFAVAEEAPPPSEDDRTRTAPTAARPPRKKGA